MTLSERESTMLNPASIDSAHEGKPPLLKQSDAILSARTPDLNARNIWAEVGCENANDRPCLGRTGDCGGFSADFDARRLAGMEAGGASCGNVGDEGGDDVMGRRSAGTNEEVAVGSDT
jgi:hypothetical protein